MTRRDVMFARVCYNHIFFVKYFCRNFGAELNLSLDETVAEAGETGTLLPDDDGANRNAGMDFMST